MSKRGGGGRLPSPFVFALVPPRSGLKPFRKTAEGGVRTEETEPLPALLLPLRFLLCVRRCGSNARRGMSSTRDAMDTGGPCGGGDLSAVLRFRDPGPKAGARCCEKCAGELRSRASVIALGDGGGRCCVFILLPGG